MLGSDGRIEGCRLHVGMPQKNLYDFQIDSQFHEVSGEAMA